MRPQKHNYLIETLGHKHDNGSLSFSAATTVKHGQRGDLYHYQGYRGVCMIGSNIIL